MREGKGDWWWRGEAELRAKQIERLHAEIERLRAYTSNPRYWEARWRDEAKLNDDTAAFLDRMADIILRSVQWSSGEDDNAGLKQAAADCRAMAERLRK